MRQYRETGTLHECGGIEVARTEERMEEVRRRRASAKSWGVEDCRLVTPAEIKELVPFVDASILLGGFYTPSVAVVDSLRFGTVLREQAQTKGAQVLANTEVEGIDVEDGRVRRVRTTGGDFDADIVVIACGVWSPRIARMAGASIPLTPAVHQMIDVGPVPMFEGTVGEIAFPIVRDVDTNMYERQHGSELEIGSYAHRPILWEPDDIPSIDEAALSPTELPFTQEDFDLQMEQAASNRDVRLSPCHARERDLGAVFFETAGWERPNWYASNEPLLAEYGDRVLPREAEWESRWWSPIINAEHLAMRDRVGMVDLSAFCVFDVDGPGACAYLQGLCVAEMDVPVGRVVYTSLLNDAGGVKADLTIMRLGADAFRVVTGGGGGMSDRKW